jgi:branched-subunit amino acid transport protein AzlD
MTFQILIVLIQCAALAAFLILWYFWVKKRMEASFLLEEDSRVMFPFKHFSWLLIGLVFVTCLIQIHFVKVASGFHEKIAVLVGSLKKNDQNARSIEDMKVSIDNLRKQMAADFKNLRAENVDRLPFKYPEAPATAYARPTLRSPITSVGFRRSDGVGFAKAAKASFAGSRPDRTLTNKVSARKATQPVTVHSMALSCIGRALVNNLRVRKRPQTDSPVIDTITTEQIVKVTEKRLINEAVWFRIVTPSGKAGWVDYRYLKLEGSA